MTSADYFDGLYADNADPWDLSESPYEQRKLEMVLAALPRRRYGTAFEPGCAIGVTTAALSHRCDHLVAMDLASAAVAQARERVACRDVVVVQGEIPRDWPSGSFDLIVLSELLYYLPHRDRISVATLTARSLRPGGDVLVVHWRHAFDEAPSNGDRVHAELSGHFQHSGMTLIVDHIEEDFLLQVYRR